ncbi:WAT1-related protein At4g15540-like [Vitis riparia]|uniref:WAT1-related protein At4g15540-like n=1 Tax=Vitis riparia TaxID=96939 RepID=UPI00155A5033|nr:WAT1-related protein At4g15540-like [Vitis riparia]
MGGSLRRFFPMVRTAWCGETFCIMGVTKGSRCERTFCGMGVTVGSWCTPPVVVIGGLGLSVCWGPSLARMAPDNWDLLSRRLFDEKWVESELSSRGARGIGVCGSCGLALRVSGIAPAVPGLEDLDMRSSRSQIKLLGTLISISGALIVTLYKGPPIIGGGSMSSNNHLLKTADNWVIGGLFFAAACLSLSTWNTCQSTTVSLIAVRDSNAWKLRPDIELISIIYSAIIGGVVAFFVQNWCIRRKGPVFASMFKPLGMGIAAIIGCYVVAWPQYREEEESKVCEVVMLSSTFEKAPMLDEPQGSISQFDGFHCGYKEYNSVYSVT